MATVSRTVPNPKHICDYINKVSLCNKLLQTYQFKKHIYCLKIYVVYLSGPGLAGSFAQSFIKSHSGCQMGFIFTWGSPGEEFASKFIKSLEEFISLWPVGAECLSSTDYFQFPIYGPLSRKFET